MDQVQHGFLPVPDRSTEYRLQTQIQGSLPPMCSTLTSEHHSIRTEWSADAIQSPAATNGKEITIFEIEKRATVRLSYTVKDFLQRNM